MCSAFLRVHVSYPSLSEEERLEIADTVKTLIAWLKEHQLEENDFIRQSLIEGLESFLFRIQKLDWLGWGYALESLQSVIMAYVALERGGVDQNIQPNTAAVLKRVGSGLKKCFELIGVSKDVYEKADFALKAYGTLMLTYQGAESVHGLISN